MRVNFAARSRSASAAATGFGGWWWPSKPPAWPGEARLRGRSRMAGSASFPHSKSRATTTARVPQGEHFDGATSNPVVKKVVNATQMKPTYARCLCIYSAGTNPWLRLKQFTRLFHLELYGAAARGRAEGQMLPSRPRARELLEDLFQGHGFPAIGLFD